LNSYSNSIESKQGTRGEAGTTGAPRRNEVSYRIFFTHEVNLNDRLKSKVTRIVISLVALVDCSSVGLAATESALEGVREIAGQLGTQGHRMKNCAFWANEAAAAGRSRNGGIKEAEAENAIPFPEDPTDADADLGARRAEVIAQVYENDDLQKMQPAQLHDAVLRYCTATN
jgi:hypothetical protein